MTPEMVEQAPAVFCGPTANAAFFVAMALAVYAVYNLVRLLKERHLEDPSEGRLPGDS